MKRLVLTAAGALCAIGLLVPGYFLLVPYVPGFSSEAEELVSPVAYEDFHVDPAPASYLLPLSPRKQVYKLSCEFSAASAIIYFFTGDSRFGLDSQEKAETRLIADVGISQNPDLGVRMGSALAGDQKVLLVGLNKTIGGTKYYGVHAPPFIDVFAGYGLSAIPMEQQNAVADSKKAILQRHLVMAWIYLVDGKKEEIDLGLGEVVGLVRGEHAVVLHGYDRDGFWAMDPSVGRQLHIPYPVFLEAIERYSVPLLEVYPEDVDGENKARMASISPTEKKSLTIRVENGSGKKGRASKLANLLKQNGYRVSGVGNADHFLYDGLLVSTKKSKTDMVDSLRADLSGSYYPKLLTGDNLPDANPVDALLIIGR